MKKPCYIIYLIPVLVFIGCRPGWIGAAVDHDAVVRGRLVWEAEECSACHGDTGEGTLIGPSLAAVADQWEAETLAGFLQDPESQLAENPRLRDLTSIYDVDMPGVRQAGDEEVRDLVVFLLHGID